MMPPVAPGVIVHTDMPAAEYHADPCPTRSLSSTVARAMVIDGCARNGQGFESTASKAKDNGNVLHYLILGTHEHNAQVIEHDSYRTNAAKRAREAARAAGKIPVKRHEFDVLDDAADFLTERLLATELDLYHAPEDNANSELTILHRRQTQGGEIMVRTRTDHVKLYEGRGIVAYDLKTTAKLGNGHPRVAAETIARYGYDIQAAAYVEAIEAAWPNYAGFVTWYWVFAETCRPYNVGVYGRGGVFKDRGQRLWNEACEMWARGIHAGVWPGYHHYEHLPEPGYLEAQENRHHHE